MRSRKTVRNGTWIWVHPALARRLRGLQPPGPPPPASSGACDSEHHLLDSAGSFSSMADLAHKPRSPSSQTLQHTPLGTPGGLSPAPCWSTAICYSALSLAEWVTPRLRPHSPVLTRLIQPVKTQAPLFSNKLCLSRGPDKKGMSSLEMQNDYSDIGIISPGDHVH